MCLISVTVGAAIFQVLAEERVPRGFVIKLDLKPVVRVVAISACIAEKILMHVVFEMAVNAGVRSISMLHVRRVTAATVSIAVFAK
jgi:hypothetical protein